MRAFRVTAVTALAGTLLSACTHYEPLSLHGAGSMRVEVEVYKGPVSLSPEAQIAQTAAVMSDLARAMDRWHYEVKTKYDLMDQGPPVFELSESQYLSASAGADDQTKQSSTANEGEIRSTNSSNFPKNNDWSASNKSDCAVGKSAALGWSDCYQLATSFHNSQRIVANVCYILNTPLFLSTLGSSIYLPKRTCDNPNYKETWSEILKVYYPNVNVSKIYPNLKNGEITSQFKDHSEVIVTAMEGLTTMLRSTAFRVANSNIRSVPRDSDVRGLLASYSYIATEYGNQVSSRVAVLRKELLEMDHHNHDDLRALLPSSDYLRGARSSDFAQLYKWLDAVEPNQPGELDTAARLRMAERLSDDYYWEKVNEVYASGQGDVSMAFIKDEIGNWNLKSFSNDPAKLLAAYRSVADATLKTAARLATGAVGAAPGLAVQKLNAAQQAASLATQFAGGETAASNTPDLAAMRARIVARIQSRSASYQKRERESSEKISELTGKIGALPAPVAGAALEASAERSALVTQRDEEQKNLLRIRQDAIRALNDIMEDQAAVLLAMQEAIVPKERAAEF